MNKECLRCKEIKSMTEFYISRAKKDGHCSICKDCDKATGKEWRIKNKDYAAAAGRKYYWDNVQDIRERRRENLEKSRELINARAREWYLNNKERRKKWRLNNKEHKRQYDKEYALNNKDKRSYNNALRRARVLQRTPLWADLERIKGFYSNCPDGYHVDHIIPLKGKMISGLHIFENLQYLLAEENLRKSNYYSVGGE